MKKLLFLFFTLSMSTGLLAQSKEVIIKFNHLYAGESFSLNETYMVDGNTPIQLSRLEYYLHINSLTDNSNNATEFENLYILVNANQKEYHLGTYEVSDVNELSFHLGVAPDVNHNDPTLWPSAHPLAPQQQSMHWGWAAGYRFIAVEGMVDKIQDGIFEAPIQYHAVDDAYYSALSLTAASVETDSTITFYVDVNYDKMFENINASEAGVFHGAFPENQALIDNITGNNVFTVTENLSLEESNLNTLIYPNPFIDIINLDLNQNATVKLYSILGELIEVHQFAKGKNTISSNHLENGLYILSIESKGVNENIVLLKK